MHSRVREYLDKHAEALVYIAEKVRSMDEELARSPDFAAMINCAMIGLQKEVGFPLDAPMTATAPDFKRADEEVKPEDPKRELTGHQTVGKDKVEMATNAQAEGIKRWTSPNARRMVDDYLMARNVRSPYELTKAEAMELMDELGKLSHKAKPAEAVKA